MIVMLLSQHISQICVFFFNISKYLTNAKTSKATSIGCVGVSADHEKAREGIVLQDDLMDDTGAWLPETHAVFRTSCF